MPIPLETALPEARERTRAFFDALPREARVVVFCHFDADGLGAGAVFGRALPRMGFRDVRVVPSGRGENAFTDAARLRLRALEPDALVVTDLGVNREGVLDGVPTLYVDHHRPDGEPEGATVVLGYGWEPIPASAWLAFEILRPLADVDDLSWLAALGTLSDLGDRAPWDELPALRKRWTAKWLREGVSAVNAARRASGFDIDTPLELLMRASHPRELAEGDAPAVERLRGYRAEVQAELAVARKQAPLFSADGPWALVPIDSPCQIHPLIAQQWRGRLSEHAVIAANRGYLPGVVAFSARTSRRDLVLPELLRAVDIGPVGNEFGRGHDQASGGQLPTAQFNRLVEALGFDARARVATPPLPAPPP
jgi:single-stranded-DNA-specific exonuclease